MEDVKKSSNISHGKVQQKTSEDTLLGLEECLRVLEGSTDEHKFAGLLMVIKHLKNHEQDEEQSSYLNEEIIDSYKRILFAIGLPFLHRLLITEADDHGLSPYQNLGITLLSCFSRHEQLAAILCTESLCMDLIHIFTCRYGQKEMLECILILSAMMSFKEYTDIKVVGKCVKEASSFVADSMSTKRKRDDDHNEILLELQNRCLQLIINASSARPDVWNSIYINMNPLSILFSSCHDQNKFQLLRVLCNYCDNLESRFVTDELSVFTKEGTICIRNGLFDLISGEISPEDRYHVFLLVNSMLRLFGLSWVIGDCVDTKKDAKRGTFISIVLKLAAIECKMMIDDGEDLLIEMEKDKVSLVSEEEKKKDKINQILQHLPVYYTTLETIIQLLSHRQNEKQVDELPSPIILLIRQTFNDLVGLLLQFLTVSRDYMGTHAFQLLPSQFSKDALDSMVVASIRLLGSWLAEDTEAYENEITEILPFLINYQSSQKNAQLFSTIIPSSKHVDSFNEADSDDEEDSRLTRPSDLLSDPIIFLIPGLLQLASSESVVEALMDNTNSILRILDFSYFIIQKLLLEPEEGNLFSLLTCSMGILINMLMVKRQLVTDLLLSQSCLKIIPVFFAFCVVSGNVLAEEKVFEMRRKGSHDGYALIQHMLLYLLLLVTEMESENVIEEVLIRRKQIESSAVEVESANINVSEIKSSFSRILNLVLANPPREDDDSSVLDMHSLISLFAAKAKSKVSFLQ